MDNPNVEKAEDDVDTLPLYLNPSSRLNRKSRKSSKTTTLPTRAGDDSYRMRSPRRGICVIINQDKYPERPDLDDRLGSVKDAEDLKVTFEKLSFEVHMKRNLNEKSFGLELEEWSKYDHSGCDAFVLCLLSHGDTESIQHPEGSTAFNEIFEPFTGEKCSTLLGKPKLFFIQACQGNKLNERIWVQDSMDSGREVGRIRKDGKYRFPTHADFLIAYSTVPGFHSFRNEAKGSWFIQTLCKVLQDMYLVHTTDILSLLTMVNKHVALDFESCVSNKPKSNKTVSKKNKRHQRKQVSCIYYTLTRKLYLMPKGSQRYRSDTI